MNDKPDVRGIVDVVRHHLETAILPLVKADPGLYFKSLIAINLLKIAAREVELKAVHLQAEWDDLNDLLNIQEAIPADDDVAEAAIAARHATLVDLIQRGDFDAPDLEAALMRYLLATTTRQMDVIGKA